MLVKYVRFGNQNLATFVAISDDEIGVAIRHPKDRFIKSEGVRIALERAKNNEPIPKVRDRTIKVVEVTKPKLGDIIFNKNEWKTKLNSYLAHELSNFKQRAKNYYYFRQCDNCQEREEEMSENQECSQGNCTNESQNAEAVETQVEAVATEVVTEAVNETQECPENAPPEQCCGNPQECTGQNQ